jgi:hypothetical protein
MHGTRRKALHLAEVLQMAMGQPLDLRRNESIESLFVQDLDRNSGLRLSR